MEPLVCLGAQVESPCYAGRRDTAEFRQNFLLENRTWGKPGDQETEEGMVVNVQKMQGLT